MIIRRRDMLTGAGATAVYAALPRGADAETHQRLVALGGGKIPLSAYKSVWKDSFSSLSLRTGGPTPAGLAAGKGTWADVGLYYNTGTGNNAKGFAGFGYGWFVDHSYNWSAVDATYPPLAQLDITNNGLVLNAASNYPLIRATLPLVDTITTPATGSGWYDNQGATGYTGTAVDGLPAPRVVVSGSSNYTARREYYSGTYPKASDTINFNIKYSFGTSNSLYWFVAFGGGVSSGNVFGNTPTQTSSAAGTFSGMTITNFANHSELTFSMTVPASPSYLNLGAGPNSATNGLTVNLYDFQVLLPPYLSALVSSLYSAYIKPPFYRETVFTIPGGTYDWSAVWGLGIDTSSGQFEIDDFDSLGPPTAADKLTGGLHTPQGSLGYSYSTGTSLAGRQITLGMQVANGLVSYYYGGRTGVLVAQVACPGGSEWNQNQYYILDEDFGFPWIGYPQDITTQSSMTIRSVEYFAPPSNKSYTFPASPPVPAITWGGSFTGGAIPVATPGGTTVATLSGGASYSVLGFSKLVVSGANLNTSGALSAGTYNFYIQGLDANGVPGIAPKMTATIS